MARLVDHDPIELSLAQHLVVDGRGGAKHVGTVEHVVDRLPLQLPRFGLELLGFAAHVLLGAVCRLGPREAIGLLVQRLGLAQQVLDQPHVVVRFDQGIEGVAAQFVLHAGRVADADDALPGVHQAFEQIVDRRVAGAQASTFVPAVRRPGG